MPCLLVRWVADEPQPGLVEAVLTDVTGKRWHFIEKVAIVSRETLGNNSEFPRPGVIRCEILENSDAESKYGICKISTERPDGVVATENHQTVFDVTWDEVEVSRKETI